MPDASDARHGAEFERAARAIAAGSAAAAPARHLPALPPWEAPVIDGAALETARRHAKERDVDVIVTAIVERLVSEGYVSREAGPLDPDRERIGFRRR